MPLLTHSLSVVTMAMTAPPPTPQAARGLSALRHGVTLTLTTVGMLRVSEISKLQPLYLYCYVTISGAFLSFLTASVV
jgi:hypothetical protein